MISIFKVMQQLKAVRYRLFVLPTCWWILFYSAPRSAHYTVLHTAIAFSLAICKGNSLPMPFLSDYYVLMFFRVQELAFTLFHVYSKTTHSISILTPVYCEFRLNPRIELESDFFDCSHGLQFDNSASTKTLKPKRRLWQHLWGCFPHCVVLPVPLLYVDSTME